MSSDIILCVDDDTTVLSALRTLLSKTFEGEATIEVAESGEEALEICAELAEDGRELSVVISDFIMPGIHGDELLVRLHRSSPHTAKIMLTGQSDVEGIKRAINEAKLFRFVEKPFSNEDIVLLAQSAVQAYRHEIALVRHTAELEPSNQSLAGLAAARSAELERIDQQLHALSNTDPLTGVCNRLRLDEVLSEELARSHHSGRAFAVLLIDPDHLRMINEANGHHAGDEVLASIARLLVEGTRKVDTVGRWSGEEFLVICPDSSPDGTIAAAEKLRQTVADQSFPRVGKATVSLGITCLQPEDSIKDVMARADAALCRAKAEGRNCVVADFERATDAPLSA